MSVLHSIKKFLSIGALAAAVLFPAAAKADFFVWQNEEENISLSFPDRWALVSNLGHDEILRIAAPSITGRYDEAQCRMRVRDDLRFSMHPRSNSRALQRVHFGTSFWDAYMNEFEYAQINGFYNDAGVGRGFASHVDITFESFENPRMLRRGIAFVSLYENKVHIFECSAEESAYARWHSSFLDILKSVDFKGNEALYRNGYYRNFYDEKRMLRGVRVQDDYTF